MLRDCPRSSFRLLWSAAVVVVAGAAVVLGWMASAPRPCAQAAAHRTQTDPRLHSHGADLAGVWWRHAGGLGGDPVRFYYFHGDGTGLYRYGVVGHNYTHSFDYAVEGTALHLVFRKTGVAHDVTFSLEGTDGQGRDWLTLDGDPRESAPGRYYRLAGDTGRLLQQPAAQPRTGQDGAAPAGHMWIDLQTYATGGQGFYFYQFRPAGLDGRGVGWFHRGDFNEWSTESLTYRIVSEPPRVELRFDVAGSTATTPLSLMGSGARRRLVLERDPRDFGQTHVYEDAGRSFGSADEMPDRPDTHLRWAPVLGPGPWPGPRATR